MRTPFDNSVICLLVLLPLALLPVTDWGLALPKLYGLMLGLALLYACANSLSGPRSVRFAVWATVLMGGAALVLSGLFLTQLSFHKVPPLDTFLQKVPLPQRLSSKVTGRGLINPDELGGATALFCPLAVALLVDAFRMERRKKLAYIITLALMTCLLLLTVLLTQSRSAYAGTALGVFAVIAWVMVIWPRRRATKVAGGILCLLAGGVAGGVAWHVALVVLRAPSGHLEILQRLELWDRGLDMLQDFPFTGVGLAQFQPVLRALYPPLLSSPDAYLPHAHDFLLQLGLDFGIPGAVNIVAMFLLLVRSLVISYRRSKDDVLRAACVGLGAGLLAFFTYGLTDAIVVGAHGFLGIWLFLGLGAALARVTAKGQGAP